MIPSININKFISQSITRRQVSLLSEDLNAFKTELKERIDNKSVLVIGGAGTIGSSYIKEILRFEIKELYVFDLNENGLTELVRDLRSSVDVNLPETILTYPIDFGSPIAEKIFENHGAFDIVANFAAHKHVRSEKDVFSIEAMIENNLLKNKKLLDLLEKHPPEHFFCVSTDKAANPVNIMGASKKLLEDLILSYSDRIKVSTARFANVAFSNGSLPLGFLERLGKNQPWSCPLNIKRFFVSPKEAGEICLFASVMGNTGDIFFPKLDPETDMVEFSKIALDLINYLGLKPDICKSEAEARLKAAGLKISDESYPVFFFESDTSGEKPFEEFFTPFEDLDLTSFKNIGRIRMKERPKINEVNPMLDNLMSLFKNGQTTKADVVEMLGKYICNFEHIEKGKNLDQRM